MRVLADQHHADLLFSLQLLLEDRLGFDLYVPVGLTWWSEGYWRFGESLGDDRLARQYLTMDGRWDFDGAGYVSYDPAHPERPIRGVTLDQFRASCGEWAIVMATVQENQHGFHRLALEAGAVYVVQCGNTGQYIDWSLDPIALVSSEMPILGRGVRYCQELESDTVFAYADPGRADLKRISSFVNCMARTHYASTVADLRHALPGFDFRIHGSEGEHGNLHPVSAIAEAMATSGWGLHCKPGDGFGHVVFGWAAIGRPLVGYAAPYGNKLAGPLWTDLVTCIDLSKHDIHEACALMREIVADPDRHAEMCRAIRLRFDELVQYDEEELLIRELLGL